MKKKKLQKERKLVFFKKIIGDNPNHLEVLTIPTRMPIDPTFAPSVTLRVFDKRLVRHPLIASTYIPLGDYTPWIKVRQKKIKNKKEQERN